MKFKLIHAMNFPPLHTLLGNKTIKKLYCCIKEQVWCEKASKNFKCTHFEGDFDDDFEEDVKWKRFDSLTVTLSMVMIVSQHKKREL